MPINTNPHIHQLIVCANVFIKKDDKFLVIKRSDKKIYAPGFVGAIGGKVDKNENPYETAIREAREEAGLNINNLKLEAVILELQPVKTEPYNWLIFYFSGDYKSGNLIKTQEGQLIWLDKKSLISSKLYPSLKLAIKDIIDPKIGPIFLTVGYGATESQPKVIDYNYSSIVK